MRVERVWLYEAHAFDAYLATARQFGRWRRFAFMPDHPN